MVGQSYHNNEYFEFLYFCENSKLPEKENIFSKDFLEKILLNPDKNIYSQFRDKSYIDVFFGDIEEQVEFLKDKEKLREVYKIFIENLDRMIIKSGLVDVDILHQLNSVIKSCFEIDPAKFNEIVKSFISHIQPKYPWYNLTFNLLFVRDNYPDFYILFKETPLSELREQIIATIYKLIEEGQESQFHDYFFDWVLKFGYLIEAYIKEILIFHLRLRYLLEDLDFTKVKEEKLTVGRLIKRTEADKTIALFRNSIFHTSFLVHYNINLDDKKIIFRDLYNKKKVLSIEEFVISYFRLIQVIWTYTCSIIYYPYFIQKEKIIAFLTENIETFLQRFVELDKGEFVKRIKEIKETLDKKYNNQK